MQFFDYYAPELAADMLRAAAYYPRPSFLAMIDNTNPAGQKLLVALRRAAGEIEAACSIARRYDPDDLAALLSENSVGADLLRGLNAARAMWILYQRLKPGSARPEEIPGVKESEQMLQDLRDGMKIFPFAESQGAGLPSVVPAAPAQLLTPNVIGRAYRLFPNFGPNRITGQGD